MSPSSVMSVADVLRNMDTSMFMRTGDWLAGEMAAGQAPVVIDLRDQGAFNRGHIAGSVHIPLRELPDQVETRIARASAVVCV
jgi:rhodanese-related sulfurtransferase